MWKMIRCGEAQFGGLSASKENKVDLQCVEKESFKTRQVCKGTNIHIKSKTRVPVNARFSFHSSPFVGCFVHNKADVKITQDCILI